MLASSVSYYKGEGVKLWKMPEGRVVRMLPTAGRALAFSSDGQLLAVAEPQAVTLWQVSDGKRVRTISESCAPGSSLSSVAFSPDGTLVAATCGLSGRMIRVWKVADGKELFSIAGDANGKGGVAFSPDGQLLSVAKGRSVKLYSASDGSEVRVLQESKYFGCLLNCAVAFSPDGQLIAASDSDYSIKIWRVSDFQEVRSYKADEGDIRAIAFVPDRKALAIAEWHRDTIKLWDFERDQWIGILRGHGGSLKGWINDLVVSPDGKYLASGGTDGLALWRIKD
jgi:WD40 repeat protein